MSQLTKSLRTRIQELTTSIETQTTELAAYKEVLQIEVAKETTPTDTSQGEGPVKASPAATNGAPSSELAAVEFTGNKTAFVVAIVKARGAAGATPKEIREVFTTRKIPQSENLIYTTVSALVKEKKLRRRDGRYYGVASATVPKGGRVAPTAKRKMSPAAVKKIRDGVKKYWAAKKAAAK